MKAYPVSACLGKGADQTIDRFDHQVHVKGQACMRPDGFTNHRTDAEVWHVMIVHHIHMHPVGTAGFECTDLFAKP